jgi:hypothetical protein
MNSKFSPFIDGGCNILRRIHDKNGRLLIQEIGFENFGKINPTRTTFLCP